MAFDIDFLGTSPETSDLVVCDAQHTGSDTIIIVRHANIYGPQNARRARPATVVSSCGCGTHHTDVGWLVMYKLQPPGVVRKGWTALELRQFCLTWGAQKSSRICHTMYLVRGLGGK